MKKDYKNIIIFGIGVTVAIGFIYLIFVSGTTSGVSGMYVELFKEGKDMDLPQLQTVTRQELQSFPRLLTMIDLLVEEKENPKESRDVQVGFFTYSILIESPTEYTIKNYMSDKASSDLELELYQSFGNPIIFDGNIISIYRWNS